jgi:hypothetical protein
VAEVKRRAGNASYSTDDRLGFIFFMPSSFVLHHNHNHNPSISCSILLTISSSSFSFFMSSLALCCCYCCYYYYLLSWVPFPLVLLLNRWCTPPLSLEVSNCSTFLKIFHIPHLLNFYT